MTKVHSSIARKDVKESLKFPVDVAARINQTLSARFVAWSRIGRHPRKDVDKLAHGGWGTAILLYDGRWSIVGGTARYYRLDLAGHRASKIGYRDQGLNACVALGIISYDDRIAAHKWMRAIEAEKRQADRLEEAQAAAQEAGYRLVKLPRAKRTESPRR